LKVVFWFFLEKQLYFDYFILNKITKKIYLHTSKYFKTLLFTNYIFKKPSIVSKNTLKLLSEIEHGIPRTTPVWVFCEIVPFFNVSRSLNQFWFNVAFDYSSILRMNFCIYYNLYLNVYNYTNGINDKMSLMLKSLIMTNDQ
jgi:hypothetical protein